MLIRIEKNVQVRLYAALDSHDRLITVMPYTPNTSLLKSWARKWMDTTENGKEVYNEICFWEGGDIYFNPPTGNTQHMVITGDNGMYEIRFKYYTL